MGSSTAEGRLLLSSSSSWLSSELSLPLDSQLPLLQQGKVWFCEDAEKHVHKMTSIMWVYWIQVQKLKTRGMLEYAS
jgi:hypothetical protein